MEANNMIFHVILIVLSFILVIRGYFLNGVKKIWHIPIYFFVVYIFLAMGLSLIYYLGMIFFAFMKDVFSWVYNFYIIFCSLILTN